MSQFNAEVFSFGGWNKYSLKAGVSRQGIYFLPYNSQSRNKGKSFNVRLSLGLNLHSGRAPLRSK